MGNYCSHPINVKYYKYVQFKVNLDILDDQHLDLIIDDILNCPQYKSIYEPIYGRWERLKACPIKYRWTPIQSASYQQPNYVLVYFYYPHDCAITMDSIIECFNNESRFKGFIMSISREIIIPCPQNISIKELCMKCHQRPCGRFKYGLQTNAVHLNVTHNYCSECQLRTQYLIYGFIRENMNKPESSFIREPSKSSKIKPNPSRAVTTSNGNVMHLLMSYYNYDDIPFNPPTTITNNHPRNPLSPMHDPDRISFQFQLLVYQAIMKHHNPSLRLREEDVGYMEQAIISEHTQRFGYHRNLNILPPVFQHQMLHESYQAESFRRRGLINGQCNQLKREHKERKLHSLMHPESNANVQCYHFNFKDDANVMHAIQNKIKSGIVSPYKWMETIPELKTSHFDPRDLMKRLMLQRYPNLNKQYMVYPFNAQKINKIIYSRIRDFCASTHQSNDITTMILSYHGPFKSKFSLDGDKSSINIYKKSWIMRQQYWDLHDVYKYIYNVQCYAGGQDRWKYLKLANKYKELARKYKNLERNYAGNTKYAKLNGRYGKWARAVYEVTRADCDSKYRQGRTQQWAGGFEEELYKLLNDNGYQGLYKTEVEMQHDPTHDKNTSGTPEVAMKQPLILNINGKDIEINWIDAKGYCMWITTTMRWKLWQQCDKYNKKWGTGMLVFKLGYVENINIGNDIVVVSFEWLKRNITNKSPISDGVESDDEIKENFSWLYREIEENDDAVIRDQVEEYLFHDYAYQYEDEDHRYNDYTTMLPSKYRKEFGAMYPSKERPR